jgi:pyruvate dehydrogenase E1 component beta subunit
VPVLDDFTVPLRQGQDLARGDGRDHRQLRHRHDLCAGGRRKLAEDGIEAEVIDLRTLRPMDTDAILASVRKTNRCVTVEEGFPVGSVGNHISAVVMEHAFDWLDAPVINCTGKDVPMPYAANLEKLALVTTDEVVAAVRKVTYR